MTRLGTGIPTADDEDQNRRWGGLDEWLSPAGTTSLERTIGTETLPAPGRWDGLDDWLSPAVPQPEFERPTERETEAIRLAREDELFQEALALPSPVSATRRFNQIRTDLGLPPTEELPPISVPETIVDDLKSVVRAGTRGTAKAISGVSEFTSAIGNSIPFVEKLLPDQLLMSDLADYVAALADLHLPEDARLRGTYHRDISEGLGSTAPFLAAAVMGGLPLAAVAGIGAGASEARERAIQAGASEREQRLATIGGGVVGSTEALLPAVISRPKFVSRLLAPLDRFIKGALSRAIVKHGGQLTAAGATEAIQEGLIANPLQNLIARELYDENQEIFEGARRSAEVGGAVGVILAAVAKLAGIRLGSFKSPEAQAGAEQGARVAEQATAQARVAPTEQAPAAPEPRQQALLTDYDQRVAAGQADPTPSQATFTEAGYEKMTRKERAVEIERLQEQVVPEEPSGQRTVDEVLQAEEQAGRIKRDPDETGEAPEALRAIPRGVVGRMRPTKVPKVDYLPKEVRARQEASRGRKPAALRQRVSAFARMAWGKATRPQELLPEAAFGPKDVWASAKEAFQRFRTITGRSADQAIRHVRDDVTKALGSDDYALFRDYLNARNQLSALDHPSEAGEPQPLRHGWENRAQVVDAIAKMDELIAQRPGIQAALDRRSELNRGVVEKLVKYEMLPERTLENVEDYVHQEVLSKGRMAVSARGARPAKRSFMRRRVTGPERLGPEYDWNTEFLETETKWLTEAYVEINKRETFDEFVRKPYDIYDSLVAEARQRREAGEEDVEWSDVIPDDGSLDGHVTWYPNPRNVLYRAFSIPEKIAQEIFANEVGELTAEQIRTVVALGGKHKPVVIPRRVAQQLDLLERKTGDSAAGKVARASISEWKRWTRLGKRIVGAQLRDFMGNAEAVIISGPRGVLREVPTALRDAWDFYYRGDRPMSEAMIAARDNGVLPSAFEATEVPNIEDVELFERFFRRTADPAGVPLRLWKAYFDRAGKYAAFQDGVFRYSAFLAYRKSLPKGAVNSYAGTHRATITSLLDQHGVDVAAAKMARDLIGDYSNTTVLSRWMRSHAVPFWSWQDTVFRRVPRFTMNALVAKDWRSTARIPPTVLRAILLSRLGSFYAAMWAWNNLVHGHKERELTTYDRMIPHILFCRNEDGTIRTFRNVGVSGEFLEWFGINTMISLLPKIEDGTLTWGELGAEMAKDPVNKSYQMVRPDLKALWEVPTGTTLFPDVLEPRRLPRDEIVSGIFGLQDEYRAAKGKLLENGYRARPHQAQRLVVGVVDPRHNALSEMYSLRERFEKRLGRESPTVARSQFSAVRFALANNDFEAYKEALGVFVDAKQKLGVKSWASYKQSLNAIDPIASKLNAAAEREFELSFLNADERKRLQLAREYAMELKIRGRQWWFDAYDEVIAPRLENR